MRYREAGDLSKQKEIREKLKCKSFDWFMKEVAYDVIPQFPLQPANVAWGEMKSLANQPNQECLDTMGQPIPGTIGVSGCHHSGGNQVIFVACLHFFCKVSAALWVLARQKVRVGKECICFSPQVCSLHFLKLTFYFSFSAWTWMGSLPLVNGVLSQLVSEYRRIVVKKGMWMVPGNTEMYAY